RMRPGGVLYVETPDPDAPMCRIFGNHWGMLHFPRHFNLFTKAKLAALAERHDLTVVHHGNTTAAPAWNMSLRNVLGWDALAGGERALDIFTLPLAHRALQCHGASDSVYSESFQQRVVGLGIAEVVSAPASPWQNPYVERLIGTIRRECLDHMIVLNAR